MTYLLGLVMALTFVWFVLSGQTSPQFLVLAGLSVAASAWIAARFRIIDREGSPYHRALQLTVYMAWLIVEIVKSNISVITRVLGPKNRIDPAVVIVPTRATTDLGKALFANSITLTPGTVTVDVDGDRLKVHALVRENAMPESFEPMDRRSAAAAESRKRER